MPNDLVLYLFPRAYMPAIQYWLIDLIETFNETVPVIYQPATDSLKNFVREVHCAKAVTNDYSEDVEVSLLFNNEELRRYKYLDGIYSKIRLVLCGRTRDVETFEIHLVENTKDVSLSDVTSTALNDPKVEREDNNNKNDSNSHLVFENIYSGQYNIEYDTRPFRQADCSEKAC